MHDSLEVTEAASGTANTVLVTSHATWLAVLRTVRHRTVLCSPPA
jgi:hypothetical protein